MKNVNRGRKEVNKRNDAGLTLIELLVAVAIVSIVIVMAFGFFIQTVRIYHRGNDESGVQNEAQLTMSQLEALVLNANQGIGFGSSHVAGTDTDNNVYLYFHDYSAFKSGTSSSAYQVIHIYVNAAKGLCFDTTPYTYDSVHNNMVMGTASTPEVLSKYVKNTTDFSVDLSELVAKKTIKFEINFEIQGRKYKESKKILLRNAVVSGTDADDYFLVSASEEDKNNGLVSVEVNNPPAGDVYMWAGTSAANPYSVVFKDVNGMVMPTGSVVWSFDSAPAGTSVNRLTGFLHLGEDVTGDLTIRATAQSSVNSGGVDASKYKSGSNTLHVKSAASATLTLQQTSATLFEGTYTITGTNLVNEDLTLLSPYVKTGTKLRVDIAPESSTSNSLNYHVKVHRPINYKGKTFPLVIACKAGMKTVENSPFDITFTEDSDDIQSVIIIAGENNIDASTEILAKRGESCFYELEAIYQSGRREIISNDEWSLTSSDSDKISIQKSGSGYNVLYNNVENYNQTVKIQLNSSYEQEDGVTKSGPTVGLTFRPVKLKLAVLTDSQTMFPITRGKSQDVALTVDGLSSTSLYVKEEGASLSTSISADRVTVQAAKTMSSSAQSVVFGIKDSKGRVIEGVTCEVKFKAGTENTYSQNGKLLSDALYIPFATEISSFDSNQATPEDGDSAVLLMSDGSGSISYSKHDGKYWATYEGKTFYYNKNTRYWCLNN